MAKRTIDILVSAIGLAAVSPILLVAAIAVLAETGRPVLFRQIRIGRGFVPFQILKFRTMRNSTTGLHITASGDSRITRVGRVLRSTKLDELPQLVNVWRGEMSLVGPRPELPEFVDLYRERFSRVLTLRPGLTDFASIRFRNEEQILASAEDPMREYRERVLPAKLDLADRYIATHSLFIDAWILVQTLLVTVWPELAEPKV